MLSDCTQSFRLYLAISALLQEVILMENIASMSKNK